MRQARPPHPVKSVRSAKKAEALPAEITNFLYVLLRDVIEARAGPCVCVAKKCEDRFMGIG